MPILFSSLDVQLAQFPVYVAQAIAESAEDEGQLLTEITLGKIANAFIILTFAYILLLGSEKLIEWLSEKVPSRLRLIIKQSLPFWRAIVIILSGFTLLQLFFRLSPSNVLALTGTTAVALGFAFKDYASSLIAGVVALFEGPYRVGDRVQINEHYGEIVSYGLRGIRIQTPGDNLVTIPHNKIWTEAISNANTGELEAQCITNFYFAHNVDVELVIKILYQAAYTSKYTQIKLPIVVVMQEQPWGTHFKLKSYPMDARDEFVYQTDLLKRAKTTLAKYGIAYPEPRFSYGDRD